MIFDKAQWVKFGKGFSVQDCAYGFDGRYCFVLVQNAEGLDPGPRTRFLFIRPERPMEKRFYFKEVGHFDMTSIAFSTHPAAEFVAVDMDGNVYSYDEERDGEEVRFPDIWPNGDLRSVPSKVVRLNNVCHVVTTDRRIFRRVGVDRWIEVTAKKDGIPFPKERLNKKVSAIDLGFQDIAAFNDNDIYAVGGAGDIWHFNGKKWQQIHFPSNELLYTVCCGGDGNVYVTGNRGSLWVGREDRWKKMADGALSLQFKDSVWFAGRLYCGNDYGLWVLKDGKLKSLQEEVDSVVATSCGRLDVSPDGTLLLTAGPHGATLYDGKKWEVLFNSMQLG